MVKHTPTGGTIKRGIHPVSVAGNAFLDVLQREATKSGKVKVATPEQLERLTTIVRHIEAAAIFGFANPELWERVNAGAVAISGLESKTDKRAAALKAIKMIVDVWHNPKCNRETNSTRLLHRLSGIDGRYAQLKIEFVLSTLDRSVTSWGEKPKGGRGKINHVGVAAQLTAACHAFGYRDLECASKAFKAVTA